MQPKLIEIGDSIYREYPKGVLDILKRLIKFTSKPGDHSPKLETIQVNNKIIFAANGFILMATKTPEALLEFDGKSIKPNLEGSLIELRDDWYLGPKPEIKEITKSISSLEPAGQITLSVKLLKTILDSLTGATGITLKIYDQNKPVEIFAEVGNVPVYLLIMPMAQTLKEFWRPPQEDNNE